MQWKPVVLPCTKKWYNLPVGLGYDELKNDLKILCIVPSRDESEGSVVEIYSVNDDPWDGNEGRQITFQAKTSQCKFILKNVPYWIGSDKQVKSYEVLARIDPCTGFYQTFTYPIHVSQNSVYPLNMKDIVVCVGKYG
ncbi:hypothetical protein POM88_030237 [Heracleum sosnowskyi]|uniref:Uncharacterized protein n=1 Tax=Heracleum sosnowskyi TaxID=360622 RepID=A0AAD8MIH8_9APIA|nr:hypothetical protein POM88_030237 [Heracleum sosnowskyi]